MEKIRRIKRSSTRLYERLRKREDSKEDKPVEMLTSVQVETKTIGWTIRNITRCPIEDRECIESPVFRTGSSGEETEWCLRLYARSKAGKKTKSAGFFLHKMTPGTRVHVEVKMINLESQADFCNADGGKIYTEPTEIGTHEMIPIMMIPELTNHLELVCKMIVGTLPVNEVEEYRTPSCKCAMSADFARLYRSQQFTDAILQVDKKQFHVHKAVLAARSKVFFAMFEHATEEVTGVFTIEKVNPSIMADVLHYIYTGKAEGLDVNKAIEVFKVADAYALMELKDLCANFLLSNMSVDNACSIAVTADLHCELKLRNAAMKFVREHSAEVFDRGEWNLLTEERPLLATNILKEIAVNFNTDCGKKKISFEDGVKN